MKSSEGNTDIVAILSFKTVGYWLTIKEFHLIPEWELEHKHLPLVVLKILSCVNLFMAKFWDGLQWVVIYVL